MKPKFIDYIMNGLLALLMIFGVLMVVVLGKIIWNVKPWEITTKTTVSRVEYECSSDCRKHPDGSLECQCHPKK